MSSTASDSGQRAADPDRAAGRAAGYCWARNPDGPGRCTRSPHHVSGHKDYYANTEWE